jgi:hypothetical protein
LYACLQSARNVPTCQTRRTARGWWLERRTERCECERSRLLRLLYDYDPFVTQFQTPFFRIENDGPVPRTIFGETPSQNTPHTGPASIGGAFQFFQDPGGNLRAWLISDLPTYFGPGPIARRRPLISRTLARMASRKFTLSRVQPPCLKLPLCLPRGPPEPLAPPCIRHRARPVTAACRQG